MNPCFTRSSLLRTSQLAVLVSSGVVLAVGPAHASDVRQADAIGQGGTTRADLDGMGMIFDTPAVMSLRPRYDVQIGGGLGPESERLIGALAMDSRTGPVGLGIAFARKTHTPETLPEDLPGWQLPGADTANPRTEMVVGGALSGAWADRRLGLGLGVYYAGETSRFTEEIHHVQATASVAGRLGDFVVIGASGQNLLPGGPSWLPTKVGGGVRLYSEEVVGLEVDAAADLESLDSGPALELGAGLDLTIAEVAVLRAGYMLDEVDGGGALTFGLGATGANGGLDYAMEVGVHGDRPQGLVRSRHLLALRFRL